MGCNMEVINNGAIMYTDEMKRAFRSLTPPKDFKVTVVDHEHFLTVKATEKDFFSLDTDGRIMAAEYMIRVKNALEMNGAIVLLVREGRKE